MSAQNTTKVQNKYPVTAALLCDLSNELEGRYFSRLCVGDNRDILVLSTEQENIGLNFRLKAPASFRIHHWQERQVRAVQLPRLDATFYIATPMERNYFCIATSRVNEKRNVYLFDSEGHLLHTYNLGHSIKDIQISADDQIWLAYGDEGVFSMEKGAPNQQGLACFDAQMNLTFGFLDDIAQNPSNELDMISDCYALNVVSSSDVWLCYYGGFPLVHLHDRQVKAVFQPPAEMRGSHCFAVAGTRHLFTGGYHYKGQIFWRDEESKRQVEIEAVNEGGEPITWNRAYGRGADLFLCDEAKIHILSLNEIGF